jgi:hypothetical protein
MLSGITVRVAHRCVVAVGGCDSTPVGAGAAHLRRDTYTEVTQTGVADLVKVGGGRRTVMHGCLELMRRCWSLLRYTKI